MSFNGSGVFQINSSGQPVSSGQDITDTVHNALTADLATGLSNCICKDGQTTVTANIPMATYKITGLGAGTARTDAASLATIQDGTGVYVATVGGTVDVITLTPSPAITAYAAGQTFRFIASGANTTNVTVNVSSVGAKAITKHGAVALTAGDIQASMMIEITYDGTQFILESQPISATTSDTVQATTSGTTKDFTVPSWARKVDIVFDSVSVSSTGQLLVQLGDSGGIETTGYTITYADVGATTTITTSTSSAGFVLSFSSSTSYNWTGIATLLLIDSSTNTWVLSSSLGSQAGTVIMGSANGRKSTSGPLTTVRVTNVGAAAFDNGAVNALYQ